MRLRRVLLLLGLSATVALVVATVLLSPRPEPAAAAGVQMVAPGAFHTCALVSGGAVKCWGANNFGQLGDGQGCGTTSCTTPVDVCANAACTSALSGVTAIAAGFNHTCARTGAGGVKCWGRNNAGQLGDTTMVDRHTPVDVSGLTSAVTAVAAGGGHTCALLTGGLAKCWGGNGFGQLGDGQACGTVCAPVNVSGLTSGALAITLGNSHTCVLRLGGPPTFAIGAACWGSNTSGQLGDGTGTNRTTPVNVCADASCTGTLINVDAIEAGFSHTCAASGGGLKCWGQNDQGQLGDGTATNRNTPVNVCADATCTANLTGVALVNAGGLHTCVRTTTSGAKCWGFNDFGQLGKGSTTPHPVPASVPGLSGVNAIAAGVHHTCAITGGGLKCWGSNFSGQLGATTSEMCGATPCSTTPLDVVVTKPTPTPTKQPTGDTDGDGCTDTQENGPDERFGGRRSYLNFWDFFDTPLPPGDPGTGEKDRIISVGDIAGVVAKFGTFEGGPANDSGHLYNAAFDRTLKAGGDPWDTGPPDGSVGAQDIFLSVGQFGHTCAA